jgi:hypothetical protein
MSRPSWRLSAAAATGQRENIGAATRRMVLAALRAALAPMSIRTIAMLAGISYDRVRRALEPLCAQGFVAASGPANNRRYALTVTGMGLHPGGLASASAAGGHAATPPPAARPGSAAA